MGLIQKEYQALLLGVQRLHRTEVGPAAFLAAMDAAWRELASSFTALRNRFTPEILKSDTWVVEVSLHSPDLQQISINRNLEALHSLRRDASGARLGRQLLAEFPGPLPAASRVVVHPGAGLRKTIRVPAYLRGSRLRQSVAYLVETETPFRRDLIYWGFRPNSDHRNGGRSIDLVAVPKQIVDTLSEELREAKIDLRELWFREDDARQEPILLHRNLPPRWRIMRRVRLALAVTIALELAIAGAIPIARNYITADRIQDDVDRLSLLVVDMGEIQSDLQAKSAPQQQASAELDSYPSATATLRILQSLLGEDAHVERLSLRAATVEITGATADIDELTSRLEGSALLKLRRITRTGSIPDGNRQRFSITLEIAQGRT